MSEVPNPPFLRSTRPLDSGSRGRGSTNLEARVSMNVGTPSARCGPLPTRSLSHNSRLSVRPDSWTSCQVPSSMSAVVLVGIILASTNREHAKVSH